MTDDHEKPAECECCGFATASLLKFDRLHGDHGDDFLLCKGVAWYCDLCASTMASNALRYALQYSNDTRVMLKTVCYVGNAILDALRQKASP